jgi:glycosyltransferase involved in cell wall biosynthesis
MKSICLLVQSVYDSDPRVRRKAEALAAAGYSVDVLALRPEGAAAHYVLNGINVYTMALGKHRGSLARYMTEYSAFFLWAFVRVTWLMRRRRYAVIDVNTLPDFLIFAPMVARWMGATLVLDMHEITPEFYRSKYGIAESSWIIRLLKFLERISFDFADRVITINEPIQNLLAARGLALEKTTVMMNSADEARFANASTPAGGVSEPDVFSMIYHGTLTGTYGLDVAVKAFALAHAAMPGAELWILGSGPEREELGRLARERGIGNKVRLVGQVPPSDIPSWLNRATVGILPFRRDALLEFAFPNKLPEFIIMRRPVIVSRLTAIRHYFSEGALAYFEPNNPADLATTMIRLYRDRRLCASLAARAAAEYAPIRWDLMKARYLQLVESVVNPAYRSGTAPAGAPIAH